jgi:CheY-like chemotaxis protein
MGNLQLAELDLPPDHPVLPLVQEADKASRRARDLVSQILTFSQHQEQNREATVLAPVIEEALRLLRASIPATITIRTDVPMDCPPVLCDVSQIHQVIMNLGVNAASAMRDQGGVLEVTLRHCAPAPAWLERHSQLGARHTVHLTVRDTGCGMSAAVLERIFEPFFTTKPPGEGTGLGLAMVHGIVRSHDGAIVVESNPGAGTTFHLFFPDAATMAFAGLDAGESPTAPHPASAGVRGRGERILVVDDEPTVLQVATAILERQGYDPQPFSRAPDALAAFAREPESYTAVVTDLTMPEMTGLQLAREILALSPDTPVIIASGYLEGDPMREAHESGVTRFIRKPFDLADFVAAIRGTQQTASQSSSDRPREADAMTSFQR